MELLADAPRTLVCTIQRKLNLVGLDAGPEDGLVGPRTLAAWARFKRQAHEVNLDKYGTESLASLDWVVKQTTGPSAPDWISADQAAAVLGGPLTDAQLTDLNRCLVRFEITPGPRAWHFLGQVGHETGGGRWWLELSSGTQYNGRRDLGNTLPGDGPKFKGAGALQLTGRHNYKNFSQAMNDPQVVLQGAPYVAATYPFCSAGWFWQQARLNHTVDRGATVEVVTRVVNGGLNGLEDRRHYYQLAKKHIKSQPIV